LAAVDELGSLGRTTPTMQIIPQSSRRWVEQHDKSIRRYLAEHESEWRSRTGVRRLIARVRLEYRAWRFAGREIQGDKDEPHKLY
jgi:hypothetical protein